MSEKVLIPLIRQLPEPWIVLTDLVGVQPMTQGSGRVFELNRIRYEWVQLPSGDWQKGRYRNGELDEVIETVTPQARMKRMLEGTWWDELTL